MFRVAIFLRSHERDAPITSQDKAANFSQFIRFCDSQLINHRPFGKPLPFSLEPLFLLWRFLFLVHGRIHFTVFDTALSNVADT